MSQAAIFKESIKFGSVVLAKQDECVGPFFKKSLGSMF